MDAYSSGEDLVIKTRKPYTITKQRERWTEEEHNRFLEALKLYGRAWQRIEEHIGTKTAVQTRSHAQKFFSKLEKEAVAKGVPIGQAIDIDIPPPRPKRKPSNPYPRKTSIGPSASQVGVKDGKLRSPVSFSRCKQVIDLEKEPLPEKPNGEEKLENGKENQDDNCSGVFTLLRDAGCSSVSSVNKNHSSTPEALRNSCSFREFVPSLKDAINKDATNGSYITSELEGTQKLGKPDAEKTIPDDTNMDTKMENSHTVHEILIHGKQSGEFLGALATDEMQSMQNYPRHVPVHVLDGSLGSCMQTPTSDMSFQDSAFHPMGEVHAYSNLYSHPAASANTENQNNAPRSSTHQSFPSFPPPFAPTHHNHDDYRSFLHMSSTFSSLIVSTLLQNPAAHAAASFAASLWPYFNIESSADSPDCSQGNLAPRQINSAPNMAAIAAATVAAATAWWAAHGLLPLCAPLHAAFTCPPAAAAVAPQIDTDQNLAAKTDKKETTLENTPLKQLDAEQSEALHAQNSGSKSPLSSFSESEESADPKVDPESKATENEKAATVPETQDSSKNKSRKQVDRSSCGSNSSSDIETEALKQDKDNEEAKEADANHAPTESNGRRSRSSSTSNDSRKGVSEEGRLAFQALFSREILPQSFSPPHDQKNKACKDQTEGDEERADNKDGDASLIDLNGIICSPDCTKQGAENNPSPRKETSGGAESNPLPRRETSGGAENNPSPRRETSGGAGDEALPTIGLGNGKLKTRRIGFKPYKRCSVEVKESRAMNSSQCEEKCPKRIRLEGEAST